MAVAARETKKPVKRQVEQDPSETPPDDTFWTRYSPHNEFPLSLIGSIVLHVLVIGGLFLVGTVLFFRMHSDVDKPPEMDFVKLAGTNSGFGGGGGSPSALGRPDGKLEFVPDKATRSKIDQKILQDQKFEKIPKDQFKMPNRPEENVEDNGELFAEIKVAAAKKIQQPPPKKTDQPEGPKGIEKGVAGAKGKGGPGGNSGPAIGAGGGPKSQAEIRAERWRFDLAGSAREHIAKLDAAGVVVLLPGPRGWFQIRDLRRRPASLTPVAFQKYKSNVMWANDNLQSVAAFAQEMRLRFVPKMMDPRRPPRPLILMMLPKQRERQMATLEADYAGSKNRNVREVRRTHFDFRLQGGKYQPIVIGQAYSDGSFHGRAEE